MNINDAKLTLADILELNSLNRNTFNTLVRREGLDFMQRDLFPETGHRRYRIEHSIALACLLWARNSTILIPGAAHAIDSRWSFICETAARVASDPSALGWILFRLFEGEQWQHIAETAHNAMPFDEASRLVGMLAVPVHKIARGQLTAWLDLTAKGQISKLGGEESRA